ncbi:MAG: type II toxin-antitoxin system PemK/MazF family toxin [Oscillospiraceae bacterium]|jgi:mRNA interferase MazF|nr:type II toxin-antitoxin system PemK/MazF family toxin [Oscillospiraceae bacterium]
MKNEIQRGGVYYADLEPVLSSEQGGRRPVLVLQADDHNRTSPTTIIAPITGQSKPDLPAHVRLNARFLSPPSIALLEQIRTVDKRRLGDYIGTISRAKLREVEQAACAILGITDLEELSQ